MRTMPTIAWLALLLLMGTARAQVHCNDSDTYDTCSNKLAGQVAEQARTAMLDGVAAKNTGDASAPTINDFLPVLRALVDTNGLGSEDGKLGIEWSNPLGLPTQEQNKLTLELVKSELHEPLEEALRAAALDARIGDLEDDLDEGDDVNIGFSYARASEHYGRDPRLHVSTVDELLRAASARDTDDSPLTNFELRTLEIAGAAGRSVDLDAPFGSNGMTPQERQTYIGLVEASILEHHRSMRAFAARLRQLGFYRFLDLVNNQPQWSVTAKYRARDDTVGADDFKVTLAYEKGWANVNEYRKHKARGCSAQGDAECLASYLARPDVIANLEQSLRVSFKAEYSKIQRLSFALPDSTFVFAAEPAERLSVSAGIGRYVGGETQSATRARLDASIGYEDFSDDPSRQDRGLATATLTFPVADGLFLSLGAVYATKPEFRGDVDEELSARAGIVYKLLQGE
jgi:hypothetical protein